MWLTKKSVAGCATLGYYDEIVLILLNYLH